VPHFYASIPALDHEVFKYCGYVHPLNEDHHRRMFETFGSTGLPSQGEPGTFKVLSFDEYKGDRITEDGERYGEQTYIPKQIILTRREDDGKIFRMLWVYQSSLEDEQVAREHAVEDGWLVHFVPVGDKNAWGSCIARHEEIEAGQKKLGLSV